MVYTISTNLFLSKYRGKINYLAPSPTHKSALSRRQGTVSQLFKVTLYP